MGVLRVIPGVICLDTHMKGTLYGVPAGLNPAGAENSRS